MDKSKVKFILIVFAVVRKIQGKSSCCSDCCKSPNANYGGCSGNCAGCSGCKIPEKSNPTDVEKSKMDGAGI